MVDKSKVSKAEWDTRVDLAAAFRMGQAEWGDDLLFEHMTARSPDDATQTLMNNPSELFTEITASSLHLINPDGTEAYDPDARTHGFSYPMHKSVYDAIPEANCVIHAHSFNTIAVSMQKQGLVRNNQWAIWIGEVANHEYEGFLTGPDEAKKLVKCFQQSQVTLLRGHGMIVWGRSVKEAYFLAYMLNRACSVQIASGTGPGGIEPYQIDKSIVDAAAKQAEGTWCDKQGFNLGPWKALLRKAQRDHPGFDT